MLVAMRLHLSVLERPVLHLRSAFGRGTMKKLILTTALLSFALVASASAMVGWAGNIWPNHGSDVTPTGDLNVYAQVWKAGVTDAAGQGADIQAMLYYSTEVAPGQFVAMSYQGDVGSNDEYVGVIPQAHIQGAQTITVDVVFTDLTDMMDTPASGDQAGNFPPLVYNVVDVTPVDIEVGFRLCMSGEPHTDAPFVVGSNPAIGEWCQNGNLPVQMISEGGDLYGVTVTIPAGSNPTFEYKYQKTSCNDWESVDNRVVTLPTDGTAYYVIPEADSWNNLPLGCGLGDVLSEDKTVCFQVCVDAVGTTGGVCVVGNTPELDSWGAGVPAVEIGPGLYQACITYPAGSPYPINLEYKFKKDGCDTWESVGNRLFTVEEASMTETTLTSNWNDDVGSCAPVANEDATFSGIKSQFR
jgi:hypothetical protein